MADTVAPRILNEADARAYLGGVNPGKVMAPVRLGGRNCWDRVALDQKLDDMFGVRREPAGKSETPIERWRREKEAEQGDQEMVDLARRIEIHRPRKKP